MSTETKRVTKAQVWEQALKILTDHKAPKKMQEAMEELLAPKAGGGVSVNPPKLDANGNIVEAFCRYHQRYEKVDAMIISGGKSKGYCRAGYAKWTKANKEAKDLDAEVTKLVADGDFDAAQKAAKKAQKLRDTMNKPEFFDYDKDWAEFKKSETESKDS